MKKNVIFAKIKISKSWDSKLFTNEKKWEQERNNQDGIWKLNKTDLTSNVLKRIV